MSKVNAITRREAEFKKRELTELIFRAIGATLLLAGTLVTPAVPIAFVSIKKLIEEFKRESVHPKKIRRSLHALEKRNAISFKQKNGELFVTVSEDYYEKVIRYSLKTLFDFKKREKKWEGKWFIVFFDVPEIQKNKREKLRKFLKFIGFLPYQKSVYIYPFECRQEIEIIKKMIESGSYLKYIVADEVEDASRFRSYFNI